MKAYLQIQKYDLPEGIAVEVGTDRGEGSTGWLAEYLADKTTKFYTIDSCPYAARSLLGRDDVTVICAPGEKWLDVLPADTVIAFAYLDGYDIEREDHTERWEAEYKYMGYPNGHTAEMCVTSCLMQAMSIHERSTKGTIIILDDTAFHWHTVFGKGALAVPYLISQGFVVLENYAERTGELPAYVVMEKK
jgi:hypothetical protein